MSADEFAPALTDGTEDYGDSFHRTLDRALAKPAPAETPGPDGDGVAAGVGGLDIAERDAAKCEGLAPFCCGNSSCPAHGVPTEQPTGVVLRVPLDRALDNREGADLNVGVDHIDVPVVIDPSLNKRGEFQNTYGGTRIVLREWNEQVLLHELLHAALARIPQIWADDQHNHNIISRVEVALWETGWRFTRVTPPATAVAAHVAAARAEALREAAIEGPLHFAATHTGRDARGWNVVEASWLRARAEAEAT